MELGRLLVSVLLPCYYGRVRDGIIHVVQLTAAAENAHMIVKGPPLHAVSAVTLHHAVSLIPVVEGFSS
jgi:hypothetical protein